MNKPKVVRELKNAMETMDVTLQIITDGDGRDSSSFKDRRTTKLKLTRSQASALLDEMEKLLQ
jgi:hypothetical protein